LRAGLWIAVVVGVVAAFSPRVVVPTLPGSGGASMHVHGTAGAPLTIANGTQGAPKTAVRDTAATARQYAAMLSDIGRAPSAGAGSAVAQATAARLQSGQTVTVAEQEAGVFLPASDGPATSAVSAVRLPARVAGSPVAPLRKLHPADLLVVAPQTLPTSVLPAIRKLAGVTAVNVLDAARIKVNGGYVAMLGVNPSTFREFAAKPTAKSTTLWRNVSDGGIAISYLMGHQEKLSLGGTVSAVGAQTEQLQIGGFGTVGISGVDAVVSDSVARSLGIPSANAIVISAPHARLSKLMRKVAHLLPKDASVAPLVGSQPTRRSSPHNARLARQRRIAGRRPCRTLRSGRRQTNRPQ
jgi:hypothetical protein